MSAMRTAFGQSVGKFVICSLVFWASCLPGRAYSLAQSPNGEQPDNEIIAQKVFIAPKVDGSLDDPAWQTAQVRTGFKRVNSTALASDQATVRACYTPAFLYLALHCEDSDMAHSITKITEHDGPVYTDNSVEVFLDPGLSRKTYFHFIVNQLGTKYEAIEKSKAWNCNWTAAVQLEKGGWTLEIAIPFPDLGYLNGPATGEKWGINLNRERRLTGSGSEWSGWPTGSFHVPSQFGKVVFVETAPACSARIIFAKEPYLGINELAAEIMNKTASERLFSVSCILSQKDVKPAYETKLLKLAAGQKSTLAFKYEPKAFGAYLLALTVDSPDGKERYSYEAVSFSMESLDATVKSLQVEVEEIEKRLRGLTGTSPMIAEWVKNINAELAAQAEKLKGLSEKICISDLSNTKVRQAIQADLQSGKRSIRRLDRLSERLSFCSKFPSATSTYAVVPNFSMLDVGRNDGFRGWSVNQNQSIWGRPGECIQLGFAIVPFGRAIRGAKIKIEGLPGEPQNGQGGTGGAQVCLVRNGTALSRFGKWPETPNQFDVAPDEVQPVWVRLTVPGKTPPGSYPVNITVSAHGEPAVSLPVLLKVGQSRKASEGNLKNFFPLGLYYHADTKFQHGRPPGVKTPEEYFDYVFLDFKKHNVNCVDLMLCHGVDLRGIGLRTAEKYGLKIKMYIYEFEKLARMSKDVTEADVYPVAWNVVQELFNYSALYQYVYSDEPGIGRLHNLTVINRVLAELDPVHPAVTVCDNPLTIKELTVGPDFKVTVHDCYATGDTLSSRIDQIRRLIPDRPLWMYLQGHAYDTPLNPTPAQIREEAYLSVAHGVKGIFYFNYTTVPGGGYGFVGKDYSATPKYEELAKVYEKLSAISPILLRLTPTQNIGIGSKSADVQTLVRDDGVKYLCVVNTDLKNNNTIEVCIKGDMVLSKPSIIDVLTGLEVSSLEDRDKKAIAFKYTLEPGDGRLFELRRQGADKRDQ
jgi:hypothetical protein